MSGEALVFIMAAAFLVGYKSTWDKRNEDQPTTLMN